MADDEFVDASDTVIGDGDMANGIRAATLAQDRVDKPQKIEIKTPFFRSIGN